MYVHKMILLIRLTLFSIVCSAQITYMDTTNLIPNPGFETFNMFPLGWYYKGEHYTQLVRFWSSPTGASPDAYGPQVIVPASWRKNGFGQATPHSGNAMSGITLYGCEDGKPHCREYLQVALKENLVPGQRYELSFYYNCLERSLQIDRLGVVFISEPIHIEKDICLCDLNGQYLPELKKVEAGQWVKFSFFFVAHDEASYLIIGNFDEDSYTHTSSTAKKPLPYAYYYIDDVRLKKLPPILSTKKHASLELIDPQVGQITQLDNIYFDTDKTDFSPKSFHQLYELLRILEKYPQMKIQIRGHTDDQGTDAYNQSLSLHRAKAVAEFLYDHNITQERVRYMGFGKSLPIANNSDPDGRKKNRRVEFLILEL